MYNSGLVAAIVVNDEILREIKNEHDSCIYIPFGTEYSIRFKNNKNQNAILNITIDGKDVLNGNTFVVKGNSESELKGFLDKNLKINNRFKFIEKTEKVAKNLGQNISDGIIRIEFKYEEDFNYIPLDQPYNPIVSPYVPRSPILPLDPYAPYSPNIPWISFGDENSKDSPKYEPKYPKYILVSNSTDNTQPEIKINKGFLRNLNEDGITVKGSTIEEKLEKYNSKRLEKDSKVILFIIKGINKDGEKISSSLKSRKKVKCVTCGNECKSSFKFCPECSTCLI